MASAKKGEMNENEQKLLDAIMKGSFEEFQNLLSEKDVRVDCLDNTGMTPLMHACFRGKKDMCEVLLNHGADVNSNYHENGYSALMFAALSGNAEVTSLMLQSGANVDHINSVNRNAKQMAAFVGQHQCVSVMNNFFPKSHLEYYTVARGLEKEPKLSKECELPLLRMINITNIHPVRLSIYLRDNNILLESHKSVSQVLDLLCEKNMKSRETDDIAAVKLHYIGFLIKQASKSQQENQDNLKSFIRALLKGRAEDGFPELQDKLLRQSLKEFPYPESQLLQSIVRTIAPVKIGDDPSAFYMLMQAINGPQYASNTDGECTTCANRGSEAEIKKCSACKMVMYCSRACQEIHWFTHKKFCKQLAAVYKIKEAEKQRKEEQEKKQAELAKENEQVNGKEPSEQELVEQTPVKESCDENGSKKTEEKGTQKECCNEQQESVMVESVNSHQENSTGIA